jgi:hypothetical protein
MLIGWRLAGVQTERKGAYIIIAVLQKARLASLGDRAYESRRSNGVPA